MGYNLFIIEISRYFAQILKQQCNNTGKEIHIICIRMHFIR